MQFTKATIDVEPGAGIGTKNQIPCMFNPTEFSMTKNAQWKAPEATLGTGQPEKSYVKTGAGSFSLKLVFDTTDRGTSVTRFTDMLLQLVEPAIKVKDAGDEVLRPPYVWFSWGRWRSFKAVVSRVAVDFTYFASDGTPLRANANVSFEQPEEDEVWPATNPTSHTPLPHRLHRVRRGETLDRIAAEYYTDSTEWRRIAEANRITDPLRVEPGTLLVVPKRGLSDG